ncbi:MAG: ABC transporter substrate-binding protein, partial [Oscillospiraceae bacterium]|nr:ABC transporter substrate-binding protein [Oscillospiraceae bacterium]
PETRTITDLQGTEVEIPYEVKKIATGKLNLTQLTLILGGSEPVANLGEGADASKGTLLGDMFPELEGMLVLTEDNMDPEAILKLDPDLVMLYIRSAELGDRIREVGKSVALCGLSNEEELLKTMNIMAEALGGDALTQAEKYESFYRGLMAEVTEKSAGLDDSKKPLVAYVRSNGTVCGLNSMPNNWITAAGGVNVGALAGFEQYSAEMSPEELIGYDPALIFCESPKAVEFLSQDAYKGLSAVKSGALFIVPYGLSCSGLANAENPMVWKWAANIINPDIYDYDAEQSIRDFFEDFYGYTLTDAQLDTVLHRG